MISVGSEVQVLPDPPNDGLLARVMRPDKPDTGGIAQLVEHLLCKQGVIGSIPFASTKKTTLQIKVSCYNAQLILICEVGLARV